MNNIRIVPAIAIFTIAAILLAFAASSYFLYVEDRNLYEQELSNCDPDFPCRTRIHVFDMHYRDATNYLIAGLPFLVGGTVILLLKRG